MLIKEEVALNPAGYKGLSAFHKYWGKKPPEIIDFVITKLTSEKDIVLDPFLGGALITRIVKQRQRKFIGIDINPIAICLGNFFISLPKSKEYKNQLACIEKQVGGLINDTYSYDGYVASHYLWDKNNLEAIWIKNGRKIEIKEIREKDKQHIKNRFTDYIPRNLRGLQFFQNSRINAKKNFVINDLFSGRSLHNIDLLLDVILKIKNPVLKRAFLLTLTSASGQMSDMVFAISKRGKANGNIEISEKVEVGSWAIGFWRPQKHFEVNVWNCFINRAKKLEKALLLEEDNNHIEITDNISQFFQQEYPVALSCQSALDGMQEIPNAEVSLVITDPPHSDRIPYLELSEFWNAILQNGLPDFDKEIVVSNAKERGKTLSVYNADMTRFFEESYRILRKDGFLVIFFNATKTDSWESLKNAKQFKYLGCFPMNYSANSIVQDNRKGAMKSDYILIYSKGIEDRAVALTQLPFFSKNFPMKG